MLRKIETIEDVKLELQRYFETMVALPALKLPKYARNHLWDMMKTEQTPEDSDAELEKFVPTQEDIADMWYIDANFMEELSKFEYKLLAARLRFRPLPWKVLEYNLGKTRQMMKIYMDKALLRMLAKMKG